MAGISPVTFVDVPSRASPFTPLHHTVGVYLFLSCQKPKKGSPFPPVGVTQMGPTPLLSQAT